MLKERMALVAELWAAGVCAQMLHQTAPSSKDHHHYASHNKIPLMVFLDQDSLSAQAAVKVRSVLCFILGG